MTTALRRTGPVLLGLTLALARPSLASEVVVLTYAGPIGTISADYVERGISEAESRRASAVVLRLDTPGGLDTPMRRIIQKMMNARVPVVVYVAPRGARAASAGCLIALAADVAAMAPGTNLGAAHPVLLSGDAVEEKVVNDAVAYARSLALAHDRNADWAEKAVRENASVTSEEAVQLKVVDVVSADLDEMLRQLHQRTVRTSAGSSTLELTGTRVAWVEMNWRERALNGLANPTVAYLLFLLGICAIVFEVVTPGGFLAGTFGALALCLSLVGMSNLPVQVSGMALLLLGVGFFILELKIVSHGLLSLAGVCAFVIGSLLLFPRVPGYRVSWAAIALVAALWAGAFTFAFKLVLKARRQPVLAGVEGLPGSEGVAKTELAPRGIVLVGGEDWTAEADPAPIARGEKVQVMEVRGLTLRVRKLS